MEVTPQDPLFKYQPVEEIKIENLSQDALNNTLSQLQDKALLEIEKKSNLYSDYSNNKASNVFSPFIDDRLKTKDFIIEQKDVYKPIGEELVPIFQDYIAGTDNNERLAKNQDTWDKWANGLTKAGANFLTTVVGTTVGIVYGAANGVIEGSFNAVFDNNFSNALADWNEKLGYQLPNYVSKDEAKEGFIGSLNNANFWANDVMGGLSFILGTVVSEAIWAISTGGTANIAKAGLKAAQTARWSKNILGEVRALKGLAEYKSFLNSGTRQLFTKTDDVASMMASAGTASTRAKWLNTARFLATTSGNEAGIEALHYKREMQDNFYENFARQNGREPSAEEVAEFENNLENSANLVFASNMAILAPSNLAMFGSMFNIASPFRGTSKAINKSLFGIGVEKTAEGTFKGITATTKQKAGRIAYASLKPLVTEGIWEEGLQGVTTKTAENWIESTFNPKYNNESMALSEATYEAMGEQYGTKEGWKEIGIGMIIGGGSSLVIGKGKFQELRQFEQAQKYQDEYVAKGLNQFGDGSSTASELFAKRMMLNSRVKSAAEKQVEAVKKGDDVGVMLAQQEPLIAELQFRKAIGEDTKELVAKYETALNALPKEAWNEAGIENIEEYKQNVLDGYKNLVASHEKASDFADAILGETRVLGQNVQTQLLKDALTYSIVSGQTANKAMDAILQDMGKVIGDDSVKAKSIQLDLQRLGKNKQAQVRTINNSVNQADAEVKSLSDELQRLQVSKDETKGERLQKVQAKLVEASEKLSTLKAERETIAQEVAQESKRRRSLENVGIDNTGLTATDFITGDDLATIEEKLQRMESTIKGYEGVNHQVYYDLLDLQKQYGSAKEKFFSYQNSIDAIVSGQFAPKFSKVEGLLGKLFGQKETIDDFTKEFLTETYNKYQDSLGRSAVDVETESQYVSDEEYKTFKETGEVSDEIKQKLAERVKAKEALTEREKEVYNVLTQEINELTRVAVNPNKPDLSTQSSNQREIQRLEKEKADLESQLRKGGIINAKNLKVGDKFLFFNKEGKIQEYTVKEIVEGINSVDEIITEEGQKIMNPATFSKVSKENWILNLVRLGTNNQEALQTLEEERKQKLSEVEDLTITETVEVPKEEEVKTVVQETPTEPQEGDIVTLPSKYNDQGNEFTFRNGKWQTLSSKKQWLDASKKEVDEIEKTLTPQQETEAEIVQPETTTITKQVPNQAEIDRINKEYDEKEIPLTKKAAEEKQIQGRINKINNQLEVLNSTDDTKLTDAQKLRKELSNAMQKDYPLITTDVDELIKEKPTQEDVDRYAELYKKSKLDKFEQDEFDKLQPRMQKWFMAQSLPSLSGMSVADVVELIEQLETQIDKEETVTEITAEDILESAEANDARAQNRVDILQNMSGSAVIKIQDNKVFFAQIDVRNLIGKLIQTVSIVEVQTVNKDGKLTKAKPLTTALLNQNYGVVGTEFKLGDTKIVIGERGNIVMSIEDYNKVKDIINLYYFDSKTGKWSWADLYEAIPDGTKRKKQSEYNTNTESDTIYNVEQGEDLTLFVDMTTDWNRDLIDAALQEVSDNDVVSEETKDKIRKTLEITSKKDRENNSTMKATGKDVTDDNFMLIRKRFADKFIELVETEGVATLPKKIDLNVEVPVMELFLGTPDFVLDENNNPTEFGITERGVEEVITQGYVQGQETVLADKKIKTEDVSRLFVSNLAKANPDVKIPVVVLRKGKHQFVFPISLIRTTENQVQKLDDILAKSQDFIQARKEINNLMISLGSNTRLIADSDMQLEDIRQELENYTTHRTADELASADYNKASLTTDATIKIDLEDTLISSPKITVDYSKASIGSLEENELGAVELRKEIVKDIIEIRKIVNTSPEIPDHSRFVEAFAENDVQNAGTDILNRKDINFMRKTFFSGEKKIPIQGKDIAVKTIGKDKLLSLRSKLEKLEFYENQVKTIRDKETAKKLNC